VVRRGKDFIAIDKKGVDGLKPRLKDTKFRVEDEVVTGIAVKGIRFSGSTLRFMIPVAALAETERGPVIIVRETERLRERPVEPLVDALNDLNIRCEVKDARDGKSKFVVVTPSSEKGGKTSIRGDVSSQFITGLLLACPRFEKDTDIFVTTEVESKPYVRLTLNVLRDFGVEVYVTEDLRHFKIRGNQSYMPREFEVEGDFSSAAFLLAAGAINGEVEVNGLNIESAQGDKAIVDILSRMGARLVKKGEGITARKSKLGGIEINLRDTPDLGPICAVLGCHAKGKTIISGAGRLRIKESDRLSAITRELRKMGAIIKEEKDGLIVNGGVRLKGAVIDPHNDHRIAMSCAVAALAAEGETRILNPGCVSKSYPDFFRDLKSLGAGVKGA
jgi:3-phosphoshikimate 1-carboxyvinyltransferase